MIYDLVDRVSREYTAPMSPVRHIAIIGGGASGVLLALHLLRDPRAAVQVTLIDPAPELGRGLAYATSCDAHILNVPASNMSAFTDAPDDFWNWLRARNLVTGDDRFVFVPRRHFGAYLGDLLADFADAGLTAVRDRAIDLHPGATGVDVVLAGGTSLSTDVAVLATGHDHRPDLYARVAVTPGSAADTPLDPQAGVLILGTGLSMVDAWLSLKSAGHRGPITAISRHGLLPHPHTGPSRLSLADVPVGAGPRALTHWVRERVAGHGGNWRDIVDGLRPHSQRIWQAWSAASRRAFLRHLRPWWNVHRHRLPAELHRRLSAALATGELTVQAARLEGLARAHTRIQVTLRRGSHVEIRTVDRVYDCTGLAVDLEQSSNPLLRALLARGLARPDPVRIGLDVTTQCALVDRDGVPSSRIFAIGPLTRGAFFEIEAVPDIRVQAARLANRLAAPDYSAAGRRPSSFSTPAIRPFI